MNRLEQIEIQQWRLRVRPSTPMPGETSVESEICDVAQAPAVAPSESSHDLSNYDWATLDRLILDGELCASCHASRPMLGVGDPNAAWMFVIDSPSKRDIETQQLLTGRPGDLFDAILLALGLSRNEIYVTSVFKCPPADSMKTIAQCDPIVHRQIALIQPTVVVTLGEFASQSVIKANADLAELRASEQRCFSQNIPIVPTYDLSQMLDQPTLKAEVWQDLKHCLRIIAGQR